MKRILCSLIGTSYLLLLTSPAFAECDIVPNGTTILTPETRPAGTVIYNKDWGIHQVCLASGTWQALGPVGDPCDGDPDPGTRCGDGTIYAGQSPDGDVPMFTTPSDAPNQKFADLDWSPSEGITTEASNTTSGTANTALLAPMDASTSLPDIQAFSAVKYCDELVEAGKSDWYLPAMEELYVLYDNKDVIDGFSINLYWSSNGSGQYARNKRFLNGDDGWSYSHESHSIRCVRHD